MPEKGNISINAKNIMPVIKKWLYSDRDIFVRELVSNCCDAVSKMKRLVSIGEAENTEEYRVDVLINRQEGTLTFRDNGLGMTADEVKKVVIAYEPVWAIGTGLTATDEQANETIGVIRAALARKYGKRVADKVRIQYGGSMKPSNVDGLMKQPEIDGGLIGGASLKAEDFARIVNYQE